MPGQEFSRSLKRISVLENLQHCSAQLVNGFYIQQELTEVACEKSYYKGPKMLLARGVPNSSYAIDLN